LHFSLTLPFARHLTSYQSLKKGDAKAGEKVLVIGASGGCGAAGVQLARAMGLSEIVGVCSARNAEFVQSLGATKIVDYAVHPTLTDALERGSFDCVYDTATNSGAGEDYASVSLELVKPDRKVVAINGGAGTWLKYFVGWQRVTDAQHALVVTDHSRTDLDAILDLMLPNRKADPQAAQLAFAPVIDQVFPFTPAGMEQAFTKLQSRRARGKLVFDLDQRQ
jgi:NADPH:quinone reductase-like Zn-dependent oxidoreductase